MNKTVSKILLSSLLLFSFSCSQVSPLATTTQNEIKTYANTPDQPTLPKIKLKIKKAEISISEDDLNTQLKSILDLSNDKKIQDVKLTILPNANMRGEGILLQKIPLVSNPLKIPFVIEGPLTVQNKNVIKFEATKVKVAGISVKSLMDIVGIELANLAKIKDSFGRIEVSGNSVLLIIEKFTSDIVIDGTIKNVQSEDKFLTIIF